MAEFDPKTLSKKENYRLLTSIVTPRPIAFITSISDVGVLNAAPFSYFNIISADPPLVSVSIGRKAERQKDTAKNILQTEEFVIHVADEDNIKQVNESSANLQPEESEVEHTKLSPMVSSVVGVPSLKESQVRLECKLEQHLVFEGEEGATDVIIGRIVSYSADDKVVKDGSIQTEKVKPVARLGGKKYAKLGKVFELERPE
ncbi:flavin reductase family protein [Alkalicoccus daliensis]|uniref:NADH-FMN oxidoreductase RutF, flavin reductase (DIM6/NTAB) family n=1 Tax=Alkalicoccus daliensis TaxID=745820 RepID=A0A1H0DYI2_9BACI|nr:flavin reductase family protein [Alkalicoccus daliensis]SDN75128.1 NADH-FMN oxidoreductase RutF, flavin reductase (DIM6/NTAB) family [Alkalicoccus daliensis]